MINEVVNHYDRRTTKQKKSTIKRHSYGPTIWFFLLTDLNALFWFTADFGAFRPPWEDDSFRVRLHQFWITEITPFGLAFSDGRYGILIFVIITIGLFISSTFICRSRILGFVTCIAVFLWFYVGWLFAVYRMT